MPFTRITGRPPPRPREEPVCAVIWVHQFRDRRNAFCGNLFFAKLKNGGLFDIQLPAPSVPLDDDAIGRYWLFDGLGCGLLIGLPAVLRKCRTCKQRPERNARQG